MYILHNIICKKFLFHHRFRTYMLPNCRTILPQPSMSECSLNTQTYCNPMDFVTVILKNHMINDKLSPLIMNRKSTVIFFLRMPAWQLYNTVHRIWKNTLRIFLITLRIFLIHLKWMEMNRT